MTYLFVDESGDIGLSPSSRRYFIFGFVYCEDPSQLRHNLRDYLRRLHTLDFYPKQLNELKFNLPRQRLIKKGYTEDDLKGYDNFTYNIRKSICNIICSQSDGLFVCIVDKTTRTKMTWTPETLGNYVFANTLHRNILNNLTLRQGLKLYFDAGRLSRIPANKFKQYLLDKDSYFRNRGFRRNDSYILRAEDIPSINEPCIWAADFLAGAFYYKYALNDSVCAQDILNGGRMIGNGIHNYW